MPVKRAVRFTIESDFHPICSSCSAIACRRGGRRSVQPTVSRVRSAIAPSTSKKATSADASGASRPLDSGVRTASAPVMRISYRRRKGGVKPRRARASRDPVHRLQHETVEENEAQHERKDVVRDAEDQHGEEGALERHPEAYEDGGHGAFHDAEPARDE